MDKRMPKGEAGGRVIRKTVTAKLPKLPADFQGGQYGNIVQFQASRDELILDVFQGGPEFTKSAEGRIVFVCRLILPLSVAKRLISDLQRLVKEIEGDLHIKLPGPKE